MAERLYPKEPAPRPDRSYRSWGVHYSLIYDDGYDSWTQYYRTKFGAQFSAFMHYHIRSWGGSVTLFDNRKYNDAPDQ